MRGFSIIFFFLFTFLTVQSFGSKRSLSSIRSLQYEIFLTSDYEAWNDAIETLEHQENKSFENQYLLALSYYGWLGPLVQQGRKKEAKEVMKKFKSLQESLLIACPDSSFLHSLNGAMIGLEVGLNHWKAPFLGPTAIKSIDKCLELNSSDPTGWLEKGNIYYYLPKALGGSIEKALEYYENAWKYFNTNSSKYADSWLKLQTGAMIITCYMKLEDTQSAEYFFEVMMKKYPGFYWVEGILYPRYLTKSDEH